MKEIDKLIELVAHKHEIDIKRGDEEFMDIDRLLNEIVLEVNETKEEVKPNNIRHLEDELSDILWGWLVVIEKLKNMGYVNSHQSVIKRGLKKYSQRVLPLKGTQEDYTIWNEVKKMQKEELRNKIFF